MNSAMKHSFGAELSRIAANLKETAVWPSPATGLSLHLLGLCGCDTRQTGILGQADFPVGPLDTAPAVATAGFAMALSQPQSEELSRWRTGVKRLAKQEPFPRDRQTFAYRPTELVGLAIGITKAESRSSASASWIRSVVQELPSKSPPINAWALLLYHYAASVIGVAFPIAIPARLSEYDNAELGLLIALLAQGNVFKSSEFEPSVVQDSLLERVVLESPHARDTEKLAALYGGLSLSLKVRLAVHAPARPTSPITRQISEPITMKQKILFLAANPTDETRLALDKECREIETKIRASEHRDSLELLTKWAVRPNDLLQYLHQYSPHIVHFSGHGSESEELILLDAHEEAKPVSKAALKQLFTTLKDNIRVVVLNACFSLPQAKAITEVIDCAVGMNQAIGDDAAITFAAAFYQAIGFGRSIKVAFESGKAALLLDGIPEENTPILLVRTGVDPANVFLIGSQDAAANPK
jgi:hypothetical protein